MTSRLALALAASLAPALPAAAEEGGEVVLTIGGEEVVFALWDDQSDWSGNDSWASTNIYTQAQGEAWDRYKTLTLSFDGPLGAMGSPEASLSRMLSGEEMQQLYSHDEAGDLAVTIEAASVEGELLSVSGTVSGAFGTSENWGRDIDLSEPVPFEGRFDVTLGPVE